jgi:hypothetical protein
VIVACYLLNGEWRYNLSDRVGGEVYFENVPEDRLSKLED